MTTIEKTALEVFEASINAASEAEQVLIDRGPDATAEERKAADDAQERMIEARGALSRADELSISQGILAKSKEIPTGELDPQALADLASASGVANPQGMTLGQCVAMSEQYAGFVQEASGMDGMIREGWRGKSPEMSFGVSLSSGEAAHQFVQNAEGKFEVQALVTGVDKTSGGIFVQPTRLPGFTDQVPWGKTTFWDICTKIPVSGDTFEYIEVVSKTNNAAAVSEATSSAPIGDGTGGTVLPAAGGVKPESAFAFAEKKVTVENVAHWIPITRRIASDAPQMVPFIDRFLRRGVAIQIDWQLGNGTGNSPDVRGLLNATNPYALQTFSLAANSDPTRIDAWLSAIALVENEEFESTAVLVHPLDWFGPDFLSKRNAQGFYEIGDPRASKDQLNALWGLNVIPTKAVPQGTQVIGDFTEALIGDREQSNVYVTDSHDDFFVRNILVLLGEQRFAFGVRSPKAFCVVTA